MLKVESLSQIHLPEAKAQPLLQSCFYRGCAGLAASRNTSSSTGHPCSHVLQGCPSLPQGEIEHCWIINEQVLLLTVCTVPAEVEEVPQGQRKVQPPVPSAALGCRLGAHPRDTPTPGSLEMLPDQAAVSEYCLGWIKLSKYI